MLLPKARSSPQSTGGPTQQAVASSARQAVASVETAKTQPNKNNSKQGNPAERKSLRKRRRAKNRGVTSARPGAKRGI
eukprot:4079392-Pleurochrysis_carterae.AAC.1